MARVFHTVILTDFDYWASPIGVAMALLLVSGAIRQRPFCSAVSAPAGAFARPCRNGAASIWFCGPSGFGEVLREDFAAAGLPVTERFHQELFAMGA